MPHESEQEALSKIKAYLDAGHSFDAIRAAGWASWIDHLEGKGYDLRTGQLALQPPVDAPTQEAAQSATKASEASTVATPICAKCGSYRVGARLACGKCGTKWPEDTPGYDQTKREHQGAGTSRQVESERILWRGKGLYLGGHPMFIKKDKSDGNLRLTEGALDYTGRIVTTRLPVCDIIDVSLGKYQPDVVKRLLVGDSRVLADIRNVLQIDFNHQGTTHRAEFQISGALTLPGTAEKAKEILNAFSSVRGDFYQQTGQPARNEESQTIAAPESASGPTSTERLRVLKQLLDDSLTSETEYEEKKAEILRDL